MSTPRLAERRQATGTNALSEVDGYNGFPEGTPWSQRIYPYPGAVEIFNKTVEDGKERPLAANVDYGRYSFDVFSGIRDGYRASVVVGEPGNFRLLDKDVGSVEEGAKLAKDQGEKLAESSMLLDKAFIEANRDKILVFSTRNPSALTNEELRQGWYLADAGKKAGPTVSIADPEALLRDEKEKLAVGQRKAAELKAQLDAQLAENRKSEERIPEIEAILEEKRGLEEKGRALDAKVVELFRN